MAFDDLAKRMGARPGVGSASGITDPDQIVAEAQSAARRAARTQDLVLGPILLIGGFVVLVFWYLLVVAKTGRPLRVSWTELKGMSYVAAAGVGALIFGIYKILRGIGILKHRE